MLNAVRNDLGLQHEGARFEALLTRTTLEQSAILKANMADLRRQFGLAPDPQIPSGPMA